MNKKLLKIEIIGYVIVAFLGTLLHFVYDWSGRCQLIGLFTPVNESPWEHLKLLFFPFIAYGIYEAIKLSKDKFYIFTSKLIAIIAGIFITLSIYYISVGTTGKMINIVNILSFFVGIAVAFLVSYLLINNSFGSSLSNTISIIILIIIAILFIYFTKAPIKIPLFQDPQTKLFGIV